MLNLPYQTEGSRWLACRTTALLADDMGLGKSKQAIDALDEIGAKRVLVLCPAVARFNWLREFEKFSSQKRNFQIVLDKKTPLDQEASLICSYDLASQLELPGTFDLLILDEAHFLKSHEAKRTKAVFGKQGLVRRAARVWALTGTPAPNHAGELWPLLYTFGVTKLSYDSWVERYCTYYTAAHGKQITGTRNIRIPELRELLSKVMLRRKKKDVMKELPPILYSDVVIEASPFDLETTPSFFDYVFPTNQISELEATLTEQREKLEGALNDMDAIRALEAAAKSVSTLRMYNGLQKMEGLASLIASELEAKAYTKIVIFAIHRDLIDGLRTRLKDFGAVTLYGGTPPEKRQANIDRFQNDKDCRVFIGNIQACGTAITLHAASQVAFAEQSWVPAENDQATMRVHRIGQVLPVQVRVFSIANSIDERVSAVLAKKREALEQIFDEKMISQLNRAELTGSGEIAIQVAQQISRL